MCRTTRGVTGFGARGDAVALTFNNQGHQHHRDRDAQDFGVKSQDRAGQVVLSSSQNYTRLYMPFTLTSRQYAKIDAVTQGLPPSQQHSYLATLAGKISRHSRENRKRALTDAVLAALIADALHELRAKAAWSRLQLPQERQGSGEDCVDVTAKELDRLIAAGTSTKIKTSL